MSAHRKTWVGLAGLTLLVLGGPLAWSWLSAADEPGAGKRYAILVGVEQYEHRKLREPEPLKYPVDDVTDMAKLLKKLGYEVVLLTDDTGKKDADLLPTKANIEKALQTTLRKCRAQDTVLLGFAGHGLQFAGQKDAYFCPQDARPFPDEVATLVSISKVYAELEKSFAGVKVILVDACRNDPDPSRGRGLDADSAPPPPKGVAALFSCSAGQKAYENDELKHGIFFHHVLEGLGGEAANKRHEVTLYSLTEHVTEAVPKTMRRLLPDRKQSPNLKADLEGIPLLARLTIPDPVPRVRPVEPTKPVTVPSTSSPAGTIPTDKEITNTLGSKLVLIPAGTFEMGSPESEKDRGPDEQQHTVRITKAFYLGKYEVTRGEFRKFVAATDYKTEAEKDGKGGYGYTGDEKSPFAQKPEFTWRNPGFEQTDSHPVVNVSWNDAVEFCKWLSKQEGKTYRLPTEAEWEYACRAGTTTRWHGGNDEGDLEAIGNVADASLKLKYPGASWSKSWNDSYPFTAPAGKFTANKFGLYDMHGNVWEWCSDWYGEKYYATSPANDPPGPATGSFRVRRGGGWGSGPVYCRSADRGWLSPSYRFNGLGFRLARSSKE